MTILQHSIAQAAAAGGYQIARSLRFNSADSAKLTRTPASAGNRRTWTWSGWVKRSRLGATNEGIFEAYSATPAVTTFSFSSDALRLQLYTDPTTNLFFTTAAVFRDVSAWYHIVLAFDTTQASTANVAKIYVNGVQQTVNFTAVTGSYVQNTQWLVNSSGVLHNIGVYNNADLLNGYMADVNFVDGQALTPSSFGETDSATGVWVPKAYTGTFGTNGFWLKFDDNSNTTATTLGKDSSGNGNNWTPNNFSVTAGVNNDSLVDSPTNYGTDTGAGGEVRGNYCTLNPLFNLDTGRNVLSEGNLKTLSPPGDAAGVHTSGTIAVSSGKWYWEGTYFQSSDPGFDPGIGIGNRNSDTNRISYNNSGSKTNNGSTTSYGASYVSGDIIGVALDMDAGTIAFYKNGVSQGTAFTGISGTYFPQFINIRQSSISCGWTANFGQRPFAYTAPSGFKALCTTNLPTPAIGASASTLASKNFDISLWTGNGTTQSITNSGSFQPDFVWIKARPNNNWHNLFDAVRGVGRRLVTNSTDAEVLNQDYGYLSAFNANGFGVSAGTLGADNVNRNGDNYVGWQWKANGAGSSNTAGTITSTVSANTTAGISIVTYAGAAASTVGHGLGASPAMIMLKQRNLTGDWIVYHRSLGKDFWIPLSGIAAASNVANYWGTSTPSSTVFGTAPTSGFSNAAGNIVAYCFAEVAGFSRFSSYTGNGSADGVFVYCGFRPRFIIAKRTDTTGNWTMMDTARDPYNVVGRWLYPNDPSAEASTFTPLDILSNGFKLRVSDATWNASGGTYIFMAFAEAPFQYSRAR